MLARAQGDSDVWARGASETEAAAGGRLGSRRPAAYQGGGAERGGAPGLWGARVVTALLRRFLVRAGLKANSSAAAFGACVVHMPRSICTTCARHPRGYQHRIHGDRAERCPRAQARGRGCAQGTAGAAELRPAGAEAAGDARRGWASAAAAAAAAEAAHAGGTQAALTRLQATPEFARWRARRGWAAADVARANRCVALLKVCGGRLSERAADALQLLALLCL